jgi:hypothetical protein
MPIFPLSSTYIRNIDPPTIWAVLLAWKRAGRLRQVVRDCGVILSISNRSIGRCFHSCRSAARGIHLGGPACGKVRCEALPFDDAQWAGAVRFGFLDGRAYSPGPAAAGQSTASLLFRRTHAGVFVHAGPSPVLGSRHNSGFYRVQVNVLHLLVVFLHRAQGTTPPGRKIFMGSGAGSKKRSCHSSPAALRP